MSEEVRLGIMVLCHLIFIVTFAAKGLDASGTQDFPAVINFPDARGNLQPSILRINDIVAPAVNESDVKFFIYTRQDTGQVFIGDMTSLNSSSFHPQLPTIFLTHGYRSTMHANAVQDLKDMYLKVKECNVVAVDWSSIADNILYFVVKNQTKDVGAYVAKFIDFLVLQGGTDIRNVHLSGHSLGAHVMGLAGKKVQSGKVSRITGIDPAGILFTLEDVEDRLAAGDADFVDVIHACGGALAFKYAIGDADFFPNGGNSPMPGCGGDIGGACSHERAWQYFLESINSTDFKAVPCSSYEDFKDGLCDGLPKISMGEHAPTSARGSYYLDTAPDSPYALG